MNNMSILKVLLVEDEPVTRRALEHAFEKNSINFFSAVNLKQAIEQLKSRHFDLIVSDIWLPDGSGMDLLDLAFKYRISTPFVVITASEDERLVKQAMEKGASDFLTKPFNLRNIPTIINRNIQRFRREHEQNNPKKASVLLKTIKALISALDAKDPYTSGHSIRVAYYAGLMAKKLQMNAIDTFNLQLAAVLHDIGKIGLSDHILNKSSSLLEDEYKEAKEHVVIGSDIVGNIDELDVVATIIRHHHERWNGAGYPDGLKEEAIPYLARVLTIVDTYEAIVSRRSYSVERSSAYAMNEIKKYSGVQFDPQLVDVFLSLQHDPLFDKALGQEFSFAETVQFS